MENQTLFPNENLNGFSEHAKAELDKICLAYRQHIIKESRNIEQHERAPGTEPEIIVAHIQQAKRNYQKGTPKKLVDIMLSVVLDVLLLFLGFYFDKDRMLNNDVHLIIFVVLVFITVVLTVVKYAKEV